MKALLGVVGVVFALVSSPVQFPLVFLAQKVAEVPLLIVWGILLLIIGRQARTRQVSVAQRPVRTQSISVRSQARVHLSAGV